MKIKRLVATISAGFEDFVAKVENHEAVAETVLAEVRSACATLRVQIGRVERERARMTAEHEQAEAETARWRERAARLADDDEARALACLKRGRQCEQRVAHIVAQGEEHDALLARLRGDLQAMEQRLKELQLRRSLLSSRSARAEVLRSGESCAAPSPDTERVFERWESEVTRAEYRAGTLQATELDPLAAELDSAEEQADLKRELAALKSRSEYGS